jgi:hypothetical protein
MLATPDYTGVPFHDQEFRCYRDLSGDDKIWITARLREQKRSLTMRVSPDAGQEVIDRAAWEEWEMEVGFGTKFPSIIESNGSYSLKRIAEQADDEDAQPQPEEEEAVGLIAIAHRPGAVSYTRSGSADDQRLGGGIAVKGAPALATPGSIPTHQLGLSDGSLGFRGQFARRSL